MPYRSNVNRLNANAIRTLLPKYEKHGLISSSQAKGTKSTSFLTHSCAKNEVYQVPLACEDA